jgi:hypothetical protein
MPSASGGISPVSTNQISGVGGLKSVTNLASTGLAVVTSATPLGAVITSVGGIVNLFGKKHQAAVAAEAQALNSAVPAFMQGLVAVFNQLNAGGISPADAKSACDQLVAQYYSAVASVIKKGGPCSQNANCGAVVNAKGVPSIIPCNGPCAVGCVDVERFACRAKKLIDQGGGTISLSAAAAAQAGYSGSGQLTLSYHVLGQSSSYSGPGLAPGGTPAAIALIGTPTSSGTVVPYGQQTGIQQAGKPGITESGILGSGFFDISSMGTGTWILIGLVAVGSLYFATSGSRS